MTNNYALEVSKREHSMIINLSNYLGFKLYKMGFEKEVIDKKMEELGLLAFPKYINFPLDKSFREDCYKIVNSPANTKLANIIRNFIPEELYRDAYKGMIPTRKISTK